MSDLERADKHIVRNYDIRKRIGKGVRWTVAAGERMDLWEVVALGLGSDLLL